MIYREKRKRIYQNDLEVNFEVRKIGCFFRSALWIAEEIAGKFLSAEEINSLWKTAKKMNLVDDELNMHLGAAPLITLA